MAAVAPLEIAPPPAEQRMLLHATWKEYVLLRDLFDGPGLRMTYSRGALEIMSPSPEHEFWKSNIGRFVELFAFVRGIDLRPYGSTTFKREAKERGAEPDECYLVGKELVDFPEIVIEVIATAPLLDKLDVYAAFGVPEVWIFRDRAFTLWGLDRASSRYAPRAKSAFLPELDFEALARLVVRKDTLQALREFDATLR
jgi:Uma2 family endonuclease